MEDYHGMIYWDKLAWTEIYKQDISSWGGYY